MDSKIAYPTFEEVKGYFDSYPNEQTIYFTSDGQAFMQKNVNDAKNHQRRLDPAKELLSISRKEYNKVAGIYTPDASNEDDDLDEDNDLDKDEDQGNTLDDQSGQSSTDEEAEGKTSSKEITVEVGFSPDSEGASTSEVVSTEAPASETISTEAPVSEVVSTEAPKTKKAVSKAEAAMNDKTKKSGNAKK
ncbi:hypothetical protein ACFQ21_00130 [Ohtaekwangia kribbensis]|uniref:Uncharacterized protein n=1 Tax=Ohtaekwangia kribbensis TaxID=688913 RepID=A0ABW3JV75_9BACT